MPRVMKVGISELFVGLILVSCFGLPLCVLGYVKNGNIQNEEHSFRHKQHHNHRTEQTAIDLKKFQINRINSSNVFLRHHNHHHSDQNSNNRLLNIHATSTQPPFTRHHLRHYNRHHQTWEQRVFPSLRHQQTTTTPPPWINRPNNHHNFTTNVLRTRYFDRDSLYAHNEFITEGPKSNDSHRSSKKFMGRDQRRNQLSGSGSIDSLELMSDEDDEIMLNDEGKKNSKSKLKQSDIAESVDDYYDDDNSIENDSDTETDDDADDDDDDDDDYSNEDEETNPYGDTTNKVDDRSLPKRRIDNFETEDIYSRSYIPGTLTRYKYEMFGTHEAVERSRMSHIVNQKQHRALANAHVTKVYMEATCKHPKPRVEKIQKDPSKVYVPHCTILHRCADDTGCCSTDSHTCVAKRTQNVDLYFFVKTFGSKQGTVEKHTFINHTECHCVDKAEHFKYPPVPAMLRQATILDCTCPKLFEKVLQEDGFCRCDCSSSNSGCDWLKRGMEHFSVVDRKCINEGRCKPPTCEFGTYIKKHGRCPRKDDKLTSYSSGFL